MLRMLAKLIQEYKRKSRIYLSWDAASWHISKIFRDQVDQHNEAIIKGETAGPTVALAPLPSGAQFLNGSATSRLGSSAPYARHATPVWPW